MPTCNLMELLVMIDACRRASTKTITAVILYFGYARADRKTQGREYIAAKLVAKLITQYGAISGCCLSFISFLSGKFSSCYASLVLDLAELSWTDILSKSTASRWLEI